MEFGAFVNFFGAKDGLVHISQLTNGRPETVGEVVKEGQEVYVKLLGFDDRGKVRLSMKIVDQATGPPPRRRRAYPNPPGGRPPPGRPPPPPSCPPRPVGVGSPPIRLA